MALTQFCKAGSPVPVRADGGLSTMEWRSYVPVAVRRARARREMNKLRKNGKDIQPVEIEGRAIARRFWGKRWCEHLESFFDYANRLPP